MPAHSATDNIRAQNLFIIFIIRFLLVERSTDCGQRSRGRGSGGRLPQQGSKLVLTLGFSHPVEVAETETIKIEVKDALHFSILGSDKQEVGQFAAEVRSKRPPEPYKGKGIRYVGEFVIRKEGKAGKGK